MSDGSRLRIGWVAALALSSLALPIAGCGGGSSNAATETAARSVSRTTLTSPGSGGRTAFIARADAICRETNVKLAQTKSKGESPEQVAATVVENETIERKANGRLAKLTAPASLAAAWRKMLGYRRVLADQLGSLAAAARSHSTPSVNSLSASKKQLHGQLRRLATKLGFQDCAKVGSR